ncbi:MAG: hypothetical protein KBC91_04560 [Candidatus Omnitrophica bacterium]|nr:hypothetical protein [Candidatus Omnitrophota bacterium]
MKPFALSPIIFIALLALSGCGPKDSTEWNAYFNLFQSGQKFQGKVLHVTPSQMGDVLLHVEYLNAEGQPQAFIEMWSAQKAVDFKEGAAVDVYVLQGGEISQATAWKLKDKKII